MSDPADPTPTAAAVLRKGADRLWPDVRPRWGDCPDWAVPTVADLATVVHSDGAASRDADEALEYLCGMQWVARRRLRGDDRDLLAYAPGAAPGEPPETRTVVDVYQLWHGEPPGTPNPLRPLVAAHLRVAAPPPAPPPAPRGELVRLRAAATPEGAERRLFSVDGGGAGGHCVVTLPGVGGRQRHAVESWLLALYNATGAADGDVSRHGNAAPLALRVYITALLHAGRDHGSHDLAMTVGDFGRLLIPGGFRHGRGDHARLSAALDMVHNMRVPVPHLGRHEPLISVGTPMWECGARATLSLRVHIPRGAERGAPIDFDRLRAYGVESAALYRGYLSCAQLWDYTARHGKPVPAPGDGQKHPAANAVPWLAPEDLARMFGLDPAGRSTARHVGKHLERLEADGIIAAVITAGRGAARRTRLYGAGEPANMHMAGSKHAHGG